jgi:hypothetical protein
MSSLLASDASNLQTSETLTERGYQPKVARKVEHAVNYTPEEQAILNIVNKWKPELMNPTKYGHILGLGIGNNGPHEPYISILVKHTNELTATIPAFLDGIPVKIIDTGGGIFAA